MSALMCGARLEMDVPLVLGVGAGTRRWRPPECGNDDLRVDPEGRHDVFAVVVEVGEVGEVAGVVDGDGVAFVGKRR